MATHIAKPIAKPVPIAVAKPLPSRRPDIMQTLSVIELNLVTITEPYELELSEWNKIKLSTATQVGKPKYLTGPGGLWLEGWGTRGGGHDKGASTRGGGGGTSKDKEVFYYYLGNIC